jgi:hypothetical protein
MFKSKQNLRSKSQIKALDQNLIFYGLIIRMDKSHYWISFEIVYFGYNPVDCENTSERNLLNLTLLLLATRLVKSKKSCFVI